MQQNTPTFLYAPAPILYVDGDYKEFTTSTRLPQPTSTVLVPMAYRKQRVGIYLVSLQARLTASMIYDDGATPPKAPPIEFGPALLAIPRMLYVAADGYPVGMSGITYAARADSDRYVDPWMSDILEEYESPSTRGGAAIPYTPEITCILRTDDGWYPIFDTTMKGISPADNGPVLIGYADSPNTLSFTFDAAAAQAALARWMTNAYPAPNGSPTGVPMWSDSLRAIFTIKPADN